MTYSKGAIINISSACHFVFHCVYPIKRITFQKRVKSCKQEQCCKQEMFSQGRIFCYIMRQKDYCVLEGKNTLEEQDENKTLKKWVLNVSLMQTEKTEVREWRWHTSHGTLLAVLNVMCCRHFFSPPVHMRNSIPPFPLTITLQSMVKAHCSAFRAHSFTSSVVPDQLNRLFFFAIWKSKNLSLILLFLMPSKFWWGCFISCCY